MSAVRWGLALLFVFLLVLVANAPARLLGIVIPSRQLVMQGFDGTLWRGEAARCLVLTPAGAIHLGKVKWRLYPLSLLLFSPSVDVDSQWGSQHFIGQVTIAGRDSLSLEGVESSVSASLLQQFAPVMVDGSVSSQIEFLHIRHGLPESGKGRIVWQDARWLSPQGPKPLGSFVLQFAQDPGAPMQGKISTIAGPLEASGDLALKGRSYSVDVLLAGEISADATLQQAVSLMAQPEGDNFRLKLQGDF